MVTTSRQFAMRPVIRLDAKPIPIATAFLPWIFSDLAVAKAGRDSSRDFRLGSIAA